jgi:8-oxo-dGTP pyrophosphatase MutT (NUDIX family)|tara:strand:- start:265 stop:1050 length:786 start_codon:yes stop_codon:yes gene_type:complete
VTDIPEALPAAENPFGGILPKPETLDADPTRFAVRLQHSLDSWRDDGYRVVWLEVPIERATLIPVAVAAGFGFHHSNSEYLMLTLQLEAGAFVPAYSSHYIGAGGVAINDDDELLVVRERFHRDPKRPPRFKLPGGALHEGEHLAEGVVREVLEETGVQTRFDALVCFRHWHGYRYGKSDIYFVCRLKPLSARITIEEEEIAESRWMPVQEYLDAEQVSGFNKQIVLAARDSTGFSSTDIEDHDDKSRFEFFMPSPDAPQA